MPFLTINEVIIDTSIKKAEKSAEIVGDAERSFSGEYRETRSATKDLFTVGTRPLVQAEGEPLYKLVLGLGQNWTFDTDRFSDGKGLGPSVGPAAGTITGGGVFGSYIALGAGEQITWPTTFGDPATNDYTILLYEDAAGAQDRWAIKNVQGVVTKFLNGVSTGAASVFVSVDSAGDITIGDGVGAFDIDDLVFVPYAMPDEWLETGGGLDAPTRAFPNLPRLEIDGDFANNQVTEVQGRDVKARAKGFQNQDTAAWEKFGQVISFELVEV